MLTWAIDRKNAGIRISRLIFLAPENPATRIQAGFAFLSKPYYNRICKE